MAQYQIAWKASTKQVKVQAKGDALGSGYVKLAEFTHSASDPDVFYHHVRDALYAEDEWDMSIIEITVDTVYVAVTGLSITPATVTKAPGQTQQITLTWTPTSPSNTGVTYTTSNAAKATVNSTGLITAVATGTATITATSDDGAFTDTVVVTIS